MKNALVESLLPLITLPKILSMRLLTRLSVPSLFFVSRTIAGKKDLSSSLLALSGAPIKKTDWDLVSQQDLDII